MSGAFLGTGAPSVFPTQQIPWGAGPFTPQLPQPIGQGALGPFGPQLPQQLHALQAAVQQLLQLQYAQHLQLQQVLQIVPLQLHQIQHLIQYVAQQTSQHSSQPFLPTTGFPMTSIGPSGWSQTSQPQLFGGQGGFGGQGYVM
jgi:hypothetical protein